MRKILQVFLLAVILATFIPTIAADNLEVWANRHQNIVTQMTQRDYTKVVEQLSDLRTKDSEIFRVNNYEYLLARVLETQGNLKAAAQSYNNIINQNSSLSEYARRHLAQIARKQQDLPQEREQLKKLLSSYPNSLLKASVERRLAENQLESGDAAMALPYFRARANRSTPAGREALGQVGLIYLKLDQLEAAQTTFTQLITGSKDDQALLAAQQLDELDRKAQRNPNEIDLLARARIYLYNRVSESARTSYQALLMRFPQSKALPEALYSIGRSYYYEDNYPSAIQWYERALTEYPKTPQGELACYHSGHCYQNSGKYAEAVQRYQQVIDTYPNGEWLAGAHLNAIDSYRSANKPEAALEWCQRTIKRFPGELAASTALFQRAKIYLTQNSYEQALASFNELRTQNLSRTGPGATNRAEVDFMRAFCLDKLGRTDEAIDAYLAFPVDRDSYYSQRATARLELLMRDANTKPLINERFKTYAENAKRALAARDYLGAKSAANQALRLSDSRTSKDPLEILRQCYNSLPNYRRFLNSNLEVVGRELRAKAVTDSRTHRTLAEELIFLGLYDEGAPELRASRGEQTLEEAISAPITELPADDSSTNIVKVAQQQPTSATNLTSTNSVNAGNWAYSLAVYLNRGSHAYPAINYGESNFAGLPSDFRLELANRDIIELLYPAPYRDELTKEVANRSVDPRFMLSIARQESRFNPAAKSGSAARGLFQFIPSTADRIRQELKLTNFHQYDLYLPPTAVAFGAQYMGDLFGEFRENPYAVAASYNGGETAVRRWLARAKSNDVDRFVIEIGYHESKDYVYKVLNNYAAYKQLYQENLLAR